MRPIACKDISDVIDVKKGDFGGRIEAEKVLSQEGNCWIGYNAFLRSAESLVTDNAIIYKGYYRGVVNVSGDVKLFDRVQMDGDITISGKGNILIYSGESYMSL